MDRFIENFKKFLNKDITSFLNKHKVPLISILVVVLLTCIGFIVSFAFYQSVSTTPIVGGTTGKIADLEVKVMAEERDTNGTGLGSYGVYPYIPRAGYQYNSEKSYCTNNSTITYNADTYEADITATGHDVCYLYFDSTADLDITLEVYAQKLNIDIDKDGNITGDGTGIEGEYVKLETTALPSIGYQMHVSTGDDDPYRSFCQNGSEITYNVDENLFSIDASGKDKCVAYMDAMDVDIALKIFAQTKKGSSEYYETRKVPTNAYYELNSGKSACTGTSTLSIQNQRIVIAATSKTNCVAYLDISTGPILESMETNVVGNRVTLTLTNSSLGTVPTKYYYSYDNGKTYTESTSNSHTFNDLNSSGYVFKAYYTDASGKSSAIYSESPYMYNGLFDYQNQAQTKVIEKSGYYYLQVWGAQGGYRTTEANGGKGGYSKGYVYLNEGDTIYVHTGGAGGNGSSGCGTTICEGGYNGGGYRNKYYGGGGATDIRIKEDSLLARVIVAGGGGSDGAANKPGGAGGGTSGVSRSESCSGVSSYGGKGGTIAYSGYSVAYTIASQTTTGLTSNTLANYAGGFGFGGGGVFLSSGYGGAGGGGWYGGSGNVPDGSVDDDRGGGGGSGWLYTEANYNAWKSGNATDAANWKLKNDDGTPNANYYLKNANTYDGAQAFETTAGGSATETGHAGNGFAKVTYVGDTLP